MTMCNGIVINAQTLIISISLSFTEDIIFLFIAFVFMATM